MTGISDLELLLQLAGQQHQRRHVNKREYFDLYVQPTYDIARRVYRDYSALLDELHERVTRGDTCEPIIRYLEDRRREVQPDRDQIRALITRRLYEGRVTRFEAGVLGLLGGAVTSVGRPYFEPFDYSEADEAIRPQLGRHTALDILRKLRARTNDDLGPVRSKVLEAVEGKRVGLNQAWENVNAGYAELHASTLPRAGLGPRLTGRTSHFNLSAKRSSELREIQTYLGQIRDLADSEVFPRVLAMNFERAVSGLLPELTMRARDVREVMHDLDRKEPNVSVAQLEEALAEFEEEYDRAIERMEPTSSS